MAEQTNQPKEPNPTQNPTRASNTFVARHFNKISAGAAMINAGAFGKILNQAMEKGDTSYIPGLVGTLGLALYNLTEIRN